MGDFVIEVSETDESIRIPEKSGHIIIKHDGGIISISMSVIVKLIEKGIKEGGVTYAFGK